MRPNLRRFSGGIFRRQFLALFGTTLFFFGVASVALLQVTGTAILDRQVEVSSAYRDEERARVIDWLSERLADIQYLARSIEAERTAVLAPESVPASLALFGGIETVYSEVILVAADGRVIASKAGLPKAPTSVADRDYFKAAARGQGYISGIIRGRRTGSAQIAMAAPLRPGLSGPSSENSPVVIGFIPLERVTALVDDSNLREMGQAYLIDGEGRVVSSSAYIKAFKEFGAEAAGVPIDNLASRELKAGRSGAGLYRGYGGTSVVGAYAGIDPIGLGLVVELSRDMALRPVTAILESGLLFLVAALAVLALVSVLLSARLVAPIRALTDAALAIGKGEGYDPIDIRTGTELDQLALLFNAMASAVREREAGLKESAARDSLTGLFNHARIEEFLDIEIKRKRRSGGKVTFVMLDIDFFKGVNDEYGHLAGDEVLRSIANMLEDSVRGGDIAGRYGGEEFSVILDASSDEEVETFCERIRKRVEDHVFAAEGKRLKVTISLGWVRMGVESFGPYDFVRRADRALYAAKDSGRNRVEGNTDEAKKE